MPSLAAGSGGSGLVLADRWADLRLRVLSAAVLAPAALLLVWLGGVPFLAMLAAGFLGIAWEWGRMCRWRPAPLLPGLMYAGLAVVSLGVIRLRLGLAAVIFILLVVWCSDIGAYAVGRLLGGPRLAPLVSPGKTWSGAAGGLAAAIVGGALVAGWSGQVAISAAVLGIASQLGDLGESAVKRHFGVKDSGTLIPGHGGLLDRLDGLMAAAVVAGLGWLASLELARP